MNVILIDANAWQSLQAQLDHIKSLLDGSNSKKNVDSVFTVEEAMTKLKVSKRTLQNYRDRGKIGFSKVDGKIYFRESDLDKFLERHYHKPFCNN